MVEKRDNIRKEETPMQSKALILGALIALVAVPALAQADRFRIAGKVDTFDAGKLVLTTGDGKMETFTVTPDAAVFVSKKVSVNDIKKGDFVASAAVKGTDGKLHSTEVRIFPEAMRGVGEGQRPMTTEPGATMTNATVAEVTAEPHGGVLQVKGVSDPELIVGPEVPVTAIVPGDKGMVKAGGMVEASGTTGADGSMTASRIIIR